jgi:hypothetical protein
MGGFTYRVVSSPKYGRLQLLGDVQLPAAQPVVGKQSPVRWWPTGPSGPRAIDPMIHVSMRYYIP